MEFDRNEQKREMEIEKARRKAEDLKARLDRLKRESKEAEKQLRAKTVKHENWHRMRLAYLDRLYGYTGEMASARMYFRLLPAREYLEIIVGMELDLETALMMEAEVQAVQANLKEWTASGDRLLLERARHEYEKEGAQFRQWQAENPNEIAWRQKPATSAQWFLIERTAIALDCAMPKKLNRGKAHDWLEEHGANVRLNSTSGCEG